jgi:hypothetical protein
MTMPFFGDTAMHFAMEFDAEDKASRVIEGIGEHLRRVTEMAAGFTLGAIGYEAIGSAVGGIEELGRSLIETNATAEQLQQTFAAIYHSGAEAQQAMGWLTTFAMNAPFTRESIQQAGIAIAGIGQDITQVMPPLGNLAAVMGVSLPTAAQALQDAFEGRFAMMQTSLNVTKQQLQAFGLEVDKTGHVTQSSLIPAFEKFVAANYPDGMARQMTTFNGQMSNFVDHLQLIERTAGGAMFERLKGQLSGLITFMNANQGTILAVAAAFGQGIVGVLDTVGRVGGFLMQMMARVANYLRQTAAPFIFEALGTIAHFWDVHGQQVTSKLEFIASQVQKFLVWLGTNFADSFGVISGAVETGWGIVSGVFGGALDLLSGNFDAFGRDMQHAWATIFNGVVTIVEHGSAIVIRIIGQGLIPAINSLTDKLNDPNGGLQSWAVNFVETLDHTMYEAGNVVTRGINSLTNAISTGMPVAFAAIFSFMNRNMLNLGNLVTENMNKVLPSFMQSHVMTQREINARVSQMAQQTAKLFGGGPTVDPNAGVLSERDINARIAGYRPGLQQFFQTPPPNLGHITTVPVDQAIANLERVARRITDETGGPVSRFRWTPDDARQRGQDVFASFLDALRKAGLKLPAGVDTSALLGKGVTSLPIPGMPPIPGLPDAGKGGNQQALTLAMLTSRAYQRPDEAGYGATIASFGMVQRDHLAEMVTLLRQELAASQRREHHDEEIIATLQAQLREQRTGTQAAALTAGNTTRLVAMGASAPAPYRDPRAKLGAVHP